MTGDSNIIAAFGLLMGLWAVAASVVIWKGLSLRREARKKLLQTSRLNRLLDTSPAIPAVIRSDGKVETSIDLSHLLGIDGTIDHLQNMQSGNGQGIEPEDFMALEEEIRNCQRTAGSFRMPVSLENSDRRLFVVGGIADSQIYPNGAALLWFFDLTEDISNWEEAKKDLAESQAAFAALSGLIEEAPFPMWHRDPDMRLTLVNKAYVKAVEGDNADKVVEEQVELIEAVDGKSASDFANLAMENASSQTRLVSNTISGDRRQVKVIDTPLGDSGVAGIAIDMQETSDAKAQYRNLANAQRDLLDQLSAGVVQFDAERNLTFANAPFQHLFSLRDQWIDEKPEFARLLDRMRENNKLPEVRDFPEWRAERENWFLSTTSNEENWLLPNGTHLRILAQPLPTGGLLLIMEDRTEQAQLASARDILLRVRTATFDNLSEAIAVFSGDAKLSIWNRKFCDFWNLEEESLADHPRLDSLLTTLAEQLKKPAEISVLAELLRQTSSDRETATARIGFADGRIFEMSSVPLPDGNALFTMLDMTDSIQVEQALRERNAALSDADAVKNKFLANMSYEFRTPLTSISGFADLLKQGIGGELPEQAGEYVDAISQSADRLSQQINTVLDYSQGEAGTLPVTQDTVSIPGLLYALAGEYEEEAVSNGISLRLELDDKAGSVTGDEDRLRQAIGHLIENSLRHGEDGNEMLMLSEGHKDQVRIIISDNGPGIEAELLDRIFEAEPDEEQEPLPGLGLRLARQLIEAHGGSLDVKSESGLGTAAIVTLPR